MSKIRCDWCLGDKLYENYHDKEWGVPVFDDRLLFESLTLETFQADSVGLLFYVNESILKKRLIILTTKKWLHIIFKKRMNSCPILV